MSASAHELRARNRRLLALLAALFLLPVLLAFLMYYGTHWRPARLVNHGALIAPARPLPGGQGSAASFLRKWSLVYLGDGRCEENCRQALTMMRQTRLALNNDMMRVQRVFLVTNECCARDYLSSQHPGLLVLDATGAASRELLQTFPQEGREHTVFIVDPLGNLMMSYDARANPRGLLMDLQKLLRLSHIG
jgi:hypothetical protein